MVEELDKGGTAVALPGADLTPDRLPDGPGVLLFVRDAAMARHMEDHAYVPMSNGAGPFAIHARVRRRVEFNCEGLDELRVTDDPLPVGRAPEPYRAWLCSPVVYEITAVTPGDPDEHPFSAWVLETVKRACGETTARNS